MSQETEQRIILEFKKISIEKAKTILKKMIKTLEIEELELISKCQLEHVLLEVTKIGD